MNPSPFRLSVRNKFSQVAKEVKEVKEVKQKDMKPSLQQTQKNQLYQNQDRSMDRTPKKYQQANKSNITIYD